MANFYSGGEDQRGIRRGPALYPVPAGEESLVRSIAERVARDIIEGKLKPGEALSSVDLATQFRSSRTPVREALVMLANDELVEIAPRRAPRVAHISLEEVREIYELRAHLYGMASELIAQRAPVADIARLHVVCDRLVRAEAAGDVDEYFWAQVEFRDVEVEICGNRRLRRIVDSLRLRIHLLRHFSVTRPGRMSVSLGYHRLLVRSYDEHDAELAARLNRAIVQSAYTAIAADWSEFGGSVPD